MGGALFSPVSGLCLPTLCCMRVIRSLQTRRVILSPFGSLLVLSSCLALTQLPGNCPKGPGDP